MLVSMNHALLADSLLSEPPGKPIDGHILRVKELKQLACKTYLVRGEAGLRCRPVCSSLGSVHLTVGQRVEEARLMLGGDSFGGSLSLHP